MVEELTLSVQLEVAPGTWLELEDEDNGYTIGAGAFATRAVTMRQGTAGDDSQVVAGTVVVRGVPGNITEPLEVNVFGPDHFTFRTRLNVLEDALAQPAYRLRRTIGNARETMHCVQIATSSLDTKQPFLFATRGLYTAQIPYHPDVNLEEV